MKAFLNPVSAAVFAGLSLGSLAPAQNLISYEPAGGSSNFEETLLPSPVSGAAMVLAPFAAPPRALAGHPNGGVAVDNRRDIVYSTDGVTNIARTFYPRLTPPTAAPLPNLPIPAFPLGTNVITGIAVDPVTRHLFLTNGVYILEVDPMAGMAPVFGQVAAPANILSGLDFDQTNPGQIVGVSTAGEVVTYARGGGYLGISPPLYPWPGAVATGVAQDHAGAGGGHIYVLHANGEVYDHTTATLYATGLVDHVGLQYIASPQLLQNTSACAGSKPDLMMNTLSLAGKPGFGLDLINIPAGTPFAGIVIGLTPMVPPAPVWGGLWVGAPSSSFLAPLAGGTSMHVALPLPPGLAGLRLFAQGAAPCAAGGVVASHGMEIAVSR